MSDAGCSSGPIPWCTVDKVQQNVVAFLLHYQHTIFLKRMRLAIFVGGFKMHKQRAKGDKYANTFYFIFVARLLAFVYRKQFMLFVDEFTLINAHKTFLKLRNTKQKLNRSQN